MVKRFIYTERAVAKYMDKKELNKDESTLLNFMCHDVANDPESILSASESFDRMVNKKLGMAQKIVEKQMAKLKELSSRQIEPEPTEEPAEEEKEDNESPSEDAEEAKEESEPETAEAFNPAEDVADDSEEDEQ